MNISLPNIASSRRLKQIRHKRPLTLPFSAQLITMAMEKDELTVSSGPSTPSSSSAQSPKPAKSPTNPLQTFSSRSFKTRVSFKSQEKFLTFDHVAGNISLCLN